MASSTRSGAPTVNQRMDYYPFGMVMPGREYVGEGYKYGFNGKEQDSYQQSDFGDRIYFCRLGRGISLDRVSLTIGGNTSYTLFKNNPIIFTDYNGNIITLAIGEKKYTYRDGGLYDERGRPFDHTSDPFANDFVSAMGTILSTCTGQMIVQSLQSSPTEYVVKQQVQRAENIQSEFSAPDDVIIWQNSFLMPVVTKNGVEDMPAWLALGHEFSHAFLEDLGRRDESEWYTDSKGKVIGDEINASHLENKMRLEAGLALRTHYAGIRDPNNGALYGNEESRLLSTTKIRVNGSKIKVNSSYNTVMDAWVGSLNFTRTTYTQVSKGPLGSLEHLVKETHITTTTEKVPHIRTESRDFTYSYER